MRLIELTSNQSSFKTVRFNQTGLSLIVGKKINPKDRNPEHSFNGVGKSLLLYLIDFCLGSNNDKALEEELPDWEFRLTFEIDEQYYTVLRSTSTQGIVHLNGQELSLGKYKEFLGLKVFFLESKIKNLTYRNLIGMFNRQGKGSYISYDKTNKQENSKTQLMRNCYLLGIDIDLVIKKRELREEQERIENLQKNFKKDSVLKQFFTGDSNICQATIIFPPQRQLFFPVCSSIKLKEKHLDF